MMVAIDANTKLVYEGEGYYGYGLWPTPVLSLATLIQQGQGFDKLPVSPDLFMPTWCFAKTHSTLSLAFVGGGSTRRLGTQPQSWRVTPHLFMASQGLASMQLHGFDSNFMASIRPSVKDVLVALGTGDSYTLWRVVGVERIVMGEDLVTLRARSSLGCPNCHRREHFG